MGLSFARSMFWGFFKCFVTFAFSVETSSALGDAQMMDPFSANTSFGPGFVPQTALPVPVYESTSPPRKPQDPIASAFIGITELVVAFGHFFFFLQESTTSSKDNLCNCSLNSLKFV